MDLGATRVFTFRHVVFPNMRRHWWRRALSSCGLSFDEIVMTTFTAGPGIQTLPLWIFNNLFRPQLAPIVNVVSCCARDRLDPAHLPGTAPVRGRCDQHCLTGRSSARRAAARRHYRRSMSGSRPGICRPPLTAPDPDCA